MQIKRFFNKILASLVLVMFVTYYGSTVFFTHTHTSDTGTVTHSHPYVPGGNHSHSSAEFSIIHSLTTLLFAGGTVYLFRAFLKDRQYNYSIQNYILRIESYTPLHLLRGPPATSLI